MGSDYLLEMIHITKDFPGVRALDGASLQVKAGEVHIILGENGAGKSTLMKILSGAYPLEKGEIRINGEPVKIRNPKDAEKLGISTIYQEFNLVPSLTVAQNIFLNREFMKESVPWQIDHKRMEQEAEKLLSKLKVAVDVRKPVRELGIAEQQMVEIAKALSLNCRILIMDEPTAALTEQETDNLFNIIRDIKKQGVAVIYISHRIEEFLKIGDTITVMRDGKTLATGPIHTYTLEELIRIMVGREIHDQFPKESVPPGNV
jgi:ribose transport system ATP-binding protein